MSFSWMGYDWDERTASGGPMYNGSWSASNAVLNADGTVTLKITNPTSNAPVGGEFRSVKRGWGYGTYTAVVATNFDSMGKSVVFGGLFTYDDTQGLTDSHNEIDAGEISAWGVPGVQPSLSSSYWRDGGPINVNGYSLPLPTGTTLQTHVFTWEPGRIEFTAYLGEGTTGQRIGHGIKTEDVPEPASEQVIFNMWVTSGNADNEAVTPAFNATVKSFSFVPRELYRPELHAATRLEIEVDPEGLPNLVQNPSAEKGAWGWLTPTANTVMTKTVSSGQSFLKYTSLAAQSGNFTTELMPVLAGKYVGARFYPGSITSGAHNFKARFEWYNASKVLLSSSTQTAVLTAGAVNFMTPVLAPANTAYVKLRFDHTLVAGQGFSATLREVMVSWANTAAEISTTRTNLVTNPSFEVNTAGWTYADLGSISRDTSAASVGSASLAVLKLLNMPSAPAGAVTTVNVSGGKYYAAQAKVKGKVTARQARLTATFFNASGKKVGEDNSMPLVPDTTGSWTTISRVFTAPGTATTMQLKVEFVGLAQNETHLIDAVLVEQAKTVGTYFSGASVLAGYTYSWTGTANASTSTEFTSANFGFVEPQTWRNILGASHEIRINREELDVGTLTATVLDASLDPATAKVIRPGREVRALALVAGTWEPIFTGAIDSAEVTYDLLQRADENKQARVKLNATDAVRQLGNVARSEAVGTIASLPYLLEGGGVPWNVNGSGNQVASATIVAKNENASLLDQIAIARDTALGYAWVDRAGVLQAWDGNQMADRNLIGNPSFETDLSWWAAPTAATATRITTDAYQGVAAMQFKPDGTGRARFQSWSGNPIVVEPNKTYTLSAWVKVPTTLSQDYAFLVEFYTDAYAAYISEIGSWSNPIRNATNGWERRTFSFTTPSNCTRVTVYAPIAAASSANTTDTILVDQVELYGTVKLLDESTYNPDLDVSFNTAECINEVTVKWLRYKAAKDTTKEIIYGPYRVPASIAEWGSRSAEFTIQGTTESSSSIQAYANSILGANAVPKVRVNTVTLPIDTPGGEVDPNALLDLYDLVQVSNAAKGLADFSRITGIEHTITPEGWLMRLSFSEAGTVARPQVTPSPEGGNAAVSNEPQSGRHTLTLTNTATWYSLAVSFDTAFATAPKVVPGWHPGAAPGAAAIVYTAVTDVTTSGFTLWARRDGGTASQPISWVAIT